MAKILGAKVIATASTADKLEIARQAGADHLINYSSEDVLEQVMAITQGKGVDVVYDGVGLSTWRTSLECTGVRGMCVYFGNASGAVPAIDPLLLAKKSVFITRPKLYDYVPTKQALSERAAEVIQWVIDGKLKLSVSTEFPLSEAGMAHEFIEARKTTGKVVIRI
jgi:NADPH2:quinone reductase